MVNVYKVYDEEFSEIMGTKQLRKYALMQLIEYINTNSDDEIEEDMKYHTEDIKHIVEYFTDNNKSDNKHVLDLSFESESGWVNHIVVNLDDELYNDIKKYNIEFILDRHNIDELEKYKEHLIDKIDDDIRKHVSNSLVLTAFYNTNSYYSILLFDGGDDDMLLDCVKTLVYKIKKEIGNNELPYEITDEQAIELLQLRGFSVEELNIY